MPGRDAERVPAHTRVPRPFSGPERQVDCLWPRRLVLSPRHIAVNVRLRITRQPSGSIDGIHVGDLVEGFVYEVGTYLGCYLLAEGLAEPVDENVPTLLPPLGRRARRGVVPAPPRARPKAKVLPMHRPRWGTAADRGRRKRR